MLKVNPTQSDDQVVFSSPPQDESSNIWQEGMLSMWGFLDLYALNREGLGKAIGQTSILWVKCQKLKKRGKKQKKTVSSVKLGRNNDEDKSDETEQVIIEEEKDTSDVKIVGILKELDLE
ncbi:hypothetical protein Tco_0007145 [Tanacetum coccineum]